MMYSEFNCCRLLEEASRRYSAELRDLQEKLDREIVVFLFIVALRFFLYVIRLHELLFAKPIFLKCMYTLEVTFIWGSLDPGGSHCILGLSDPGGQ